MHPRSAPTVRFSSTAAYSHHTVPSTAAHTPTTPVQSHLELRVPLVSAPPRPACRLKYAHHTIHLTSTPSHSSTHTSSLRRRSRGLLAVPATPCNTPWGRRNACTVAPATTSPAPTQTVHPRCIPSNHSQHCRSQAASRDPGATGIAYRGLGLITLVGTTHDTSLLYAATRGRRVKHPCPTLMHGGRTAHHQAGTTCHIALAVILRLPVPHNQAMRALLLTRHPLRRVQRGDGGRCTHISHTLSICITPGPHHVITMFSVMPQPEYPRVTLQSRPP